MLVSKALLSTADPPLRLPAWQVYALVSPYQQALQGLGLWDRPDLVASVYRGLHEHGYSGEPLMCIFRDEVQDCLQVSRREARWLIHLLLTAGAWASTCQRPASPCAQSRRAAAPCLTPLHS